MTLEQVYVVGILPGPAQRDSHSHLFGLPSLEKEGYPGTSGTIRDRVQVDVSARDPKVHHAPPPSLEWEHMGTR